MLEERVMTGADSPAAFHVTVTECGRMTQGQPGIPRQVGGSRGRASALPLQFTVGYSQCASAALGLAAAGLRGSVGGVLLRERLLG
jgi:hypothetical protein